MLVSGLLALACAPAYSTGDPTKESGSLGRVVVEREFSGGEAKELLKKPASPPTGSSWTERKYEFYCTHDRITLEDGASCTPCEGEDEDRYSLQERTVTVGAAPSAWRIVGYTCLSAGDIGDLQRVEITPGMVLTEFRRLSWPKAPLTLQPGEGITLVNLATNAFSVNSGPLIQSVTLLGQTVEVEATPDTWAWHWGDGGVETTTHPGQPGPQGTVRHAYVRASDEVEVRVDITYRGRFRVNGGAWQAIPESATVRGESQEISVKEAVVQLVR